MLTLSTAPLVRHFSKLILSLSLIDLVSVCLCTYAQSITVVFTPALEMEGVASEMSQVSSETSLSCITLIPLTLTWTLGACLECWSVSAVSVSGTSNTSFW